MNFSGVDCAKFDVFMRKSAKYAGEVTKPIMITQGDDDHLVKEKSTIELFHKLGVKDRTLLLLGMNQHLIFEADQFSNLLVDGIVSWMRGHVPAKTSSR